VSQIPDLLKIGERVHDGDDWNWEDRGYHFVAKLVRDDHGTDDFEKGSVFDPDDPEHGEQNRAIRTAFDEDEWQYYGVQVYAYRCGLLLGENSLWGIEGNFDYEGREGPVDNTYFNDVMAECADEAAQEAKHKIHELMASLLNIEYKPT
jgi:hypothetical protein